MAEFRVRAIRKEELPELLELYEHLHEKGDAPLPPEEQLGPLWGEIVANPMLYYFVGEVDGNNFRGDVPFNTSFVQPNSYAV